MKITIRYPDGKNLTNSRGSPAKFLKPGLNFIENDSNSEPHGTVFYKQSRSVIFQLILML
jgi:hypothetical protein